MESKDVREPGGGQELVVTDRAGSALMRGRTGVGVALEPEIRRLRTVVSRWDLRQLLYLGRFRVHCSLMRGVILTVESEDTCNTKQRFQRLRANLSNKIK